MKKLIILISLWGCFLPAVFGQGIQSEFPKHCLKVSSTPKKANTYGAINVTATKASISGVTVPVAFTEYQFTPSGLTNPQYPSAGIAYIWGAATIKISNDSTPVLSGITYYGGSVLYRYDVWGKHYIVGVIAGFNDFAFHLGGDFTSSKSYAEISITANIMTLPFVSSLFKITPQ